MGQHIETKCLDCGKAFTVGHGGGFSFHLVRCDKCGNAKHIGFDELGELHLRFLKGSPRPYSSLSHEYDENVQKLAEVEPISEDEYHSGIEAFAGKCECGGNFTLDAPPRCPDCRSTRLEEGEITLMYD
jgi:predicted nucleic-acid-binding Zn-ribbon protein